MNDGISRRAVTSGAGPTAGDRLALRAATLASNGNVLGALAAWREAVERRVTPPVEACVAPLMARIEGRRGPDGILGLRSGDPPAEPPPPPGPAWARAWAGDLAGARRLAAEMPPRSGALGLLGVLDVLEGRPETALARLDEEIASGNGGEDLVLFRAWALAKLGRAAEGRASLSGLTDGEFFGRRLMIALLDAYCGNLDGMRRVAAAKSDVYLSGLLSNELPAAVGQDALDSALRSAGAFIELVEGLLIRMGGNLTPSTTVAEIGPDGAKRYVPLSLPPTARGAAVAALYSARHAGVAAAESALDQLVARSPRSLHAHLYRGELCLWLGRYREAWREFVTARAIERARWADIGMLAVLVLTRHFPCASRQAEVADRSFTPIPGGTLPVYRGSLRRKTGDLEGAIADLASAVAVKPTRVGARIELCLALRAAGRRDEAVEHAAVLLREAVPLLVDAAERLGLAWRPAPAVLVRDTTFEEALRSMRGNRSSAVVTWFDREGSPRVLESRVVIQGVAGKALSDAPYPISERA